MSDSVPHMLDDYLDDPNKVEQSKFPRGNGPNPPAFDDFIREQMKPEVKMYVRKGSQPNSRTISFALPAGGPAIRLLDLLELGYAIDGNQAIMEFIPQPGVEIRPNVFDDLRLAQIKAVKFFDERGYRVEFA